ncbi:MAG: histidinol dehydrogenase, partial [Roseococcus sp.]
MQLISTRDAGFEAAFTAILEDGRDTTTRVDAAVAEIIQAVRTEGDAALLRLTTRFDGWTPTDTTALRVTSAEMEEATASVEPTLLEALDLAARRIETFHRAQLPADLVLPGADGVALGLRWNALDAVG